MAEDNSLQHLLDQLADLLKMAEQASQHPTKKPLPPDINDRLRAIQGMVAYFKLLNVRFLKAAGLSDDEIINPLPPAASPQNEQERRLAEKAAQLEKRAERGIKNISEGLKQANQLKAPPKNRKKKFDRLGGRDKWKPL